MLLKLTTENFSCALAETPFIKNVYSYYMVRINRKCTLRNILIKKIFRTESDNASIAGYLCQSSCRSLYHIENVAPIIGPNKNPKLNATPIKAIPFPLEAGVETSVIIAVDMLILPDLR